MPPVADPVREIAWKAQIRLCGRFRRLVARGKKSQIVVTAIAGEFGGLCLGSESGGRSLTQPKKESIWKRPEIIDHRLLLEIQRNENAIRWCGPANS